MFGQKCCQIVFGRIGCCCAVCGGRDVVVFDFGLGIDCHTDFAGFHIVGFVLHTDFDIVLGENIVAAVVVVVDKGRFVVSTETNIDNRSYIYHKII